MKLLLTLITCQFFSFSTFSVAVLCDFSQLNCCYKPCAICLVLSAGANVHRHADGLRHVFHTCFFPINLLLNDTLCVGIFLSSSFFFHDCVSSS